MAESNNILDPSALLSLLPTLLPSSRFLSSPQDAIAALLHTIMSTLGFRLIALDESSMSNLPSATILPPEWNKNGPSHYIFKYRHEQSSLDFVLNVSKLGSRTLINAIAVEVGPGV
jgi:proteasome inhibitor subunit 1 (PI31)